MQISIGSKLLYKRTGKIYKVIGRRNKDKLIINQPYVLFLTKNNLRDYIIM